MNPPTGWTSEPCLPSGSTPPSQQHPAWVHLQPSLLFWSLNLFYDLIQQTSYCYFSAICAGAKYPFLYILVTHYAFFLFLRLRRWPSQTQIQLNSTCHVLQPVKHDLYLFSQLLPFSIMRDRSPSHQSLTHLSACVCVCVCMGKSLVFNDENNVTQ